MDSTIDEQLDELSERIKKIRKDRGLTLSDFAERCGLSPSTIQKVEAKAMSPSIAVMMKIANGLNMHIADLISPTRPAPVDLIVQKAGEHQQFPGDRKMAHFRMSSHLNNGSLESYRVILAPRTRRLIDPPLRGFEQMIFCLQGSCRLGFDREEYELQAGDTLHCVERVFASMENVGRSDLELLFVGRYPHGSEILTHERAPAPES